MSAIALSETVLENSRLRLEFDPISGWLTSFVDKATGLDVIKGALGEHTQISADPTDTWGHRVVSYNWPGASMSVSGITVGQKGPLQASLRVERHWGQSTLVEEFLLSHNSDQVEVRVTLDWREKAHLLKLRFPVALADPTGTFEIPYGSLERPVGGSEEPGQSWVDLTGTTSNGLAAGLTVINNAKHGYDVSPAGPRDGVDVTASIGITAVRSPVFSWHDPHLLDPDGYYSYQDQGIQTFRYLLVPHAGVQDPTDMTRRAAELNSSPRAMLESFHEGRLPSAESFVSDGHDSVIITAIKSSEDDGPNGTDLIVRAVETRGALASAVLDLPMVGRTIEADFGASQVRTWRVPVNPAEPTIEVNLVEWPLSGSSTR